MGIFSGEKVKWKKPKFHWTTVAYACKLESSKVKEKFNTNDCNLKIVHIHCVNTWMHETDKKSWL